MTRQVTRKKYTADEKIRIVLEGLSGESGICELCRREESPTGLRSPFVLKPKWKRSGCFQLSVS
jgi:transposase-like protein